MREEPGQDQNQAWSVMERQRTEAVPFMEEEGIWGQRDTGKALPS